MIELVNVSFTYMPKTPLAQVALHSVSLRVADGEFVGILGPTGSGKSTLIQLFNGLLKPSEGAVFYQEKELGRDIKAAEARRQVGLVFQFPEAQFFESSVHEDVAFGPRKCGLSDAEATERVIWALDSVGLDYELYKDRSPFSLSGGEMRRVAIAGVLAIKPKVLVLDEPTSGLDAAGRREVLSRLVELHNKGITLVVVTHNIDEIAGLAERLIVLNEGEIVLDDEPAKIFGQAGLLQKIGLDVPQVTRALLALRSEGLPVPTDIFTVEEAGQAILKAVRAK